MPVVSCDPIEMRRKMDYLREQVSKLPEVVIDREEIPDNPDDYWKYALVVKAPSWGHPVFKDLARIERKMYKKFTSPYAPHLYMESDEPVPPLTPEEETAIQRQMRIMAIAKRVYLDGISHIEGAELVDQHLSLQWTPTIKIDGGIGSEPCHHVMCLDSIVHGIPERRASYDNDPKNSFYVDAHRDYSSYESERWFHQDEDLDD